MTKTALNQKLIDRYVKRIEDNMRDKPCDKLLTVIEELLKENAPTVKAVTKQVTGALCTSKKKCEAALLRRWNSLYINRRKALATGDRTAA